MSFDNKSLSNNFPQHQFDWKVEAQDFGWGTIGFKGSFSMTSSVDIHNSDSEFITGVVGVHFDNDFFNGFSIYQAENAYSISYNLDNNFYLYFEYGFWAVAYFDCEGPLYILNTT